FFFFSYEGLRLVQPQASSISAVPDTSLRQSAPVNLQPVLNAFPLQNGPEILDQSGNPTGLAEFINAWSNRAHLDSYSIRADHALNQRMKLFFRFANTPSSTSLRTGGAFVAASNLASDAFASHTYTGGMSALISARVANEFRLNYSSNQDTNSTNIEGFSGATPADLIKLSGFPSGTTPLPAVEVNLFLDPSFAFAPSIVQQSSSGIQKQWNFVD